MTTETLVRPAFRFPWGVEGYLRPWEGKFLYDLACQIPEGGQIVELGSYKGRSAICLAQSARRVLAVDWFLGLGDETANPKVVYRDHLNGNYYEELVRNLENAGLRDLVTILASDSIEAADGFHEPFIDLLFIDSNHEYDYVVREWKAWGPLLNEGATVVFDDCNWDGPARVIREEMLPGGWHLVGAVGKDAAYRKEQL